MKRAYKLTIERDGDETPYVERGEFPALLRNLLFMDRLWELFDEIDSGDDFR